MLVCVYMCAAVEMGRSEDNFWDSVLSFYPVFQVLSSGCQVSVARAFPQVAVSPFHFSKVLHIKIDLA